MSWHYSQVLEEEYLEANCSDGGQSAPLSLTNTPGVCCLPGKTTEALSPSLCGTMCEPSTESRGEALLTWYLAGFRARTSVLSEAGKASRENVADFGGSSQESFVKWNRDTLTWKTPQLSLFGGSATFLETWPRWGLMQHGECFRLPTLEHDTSVKEFGSLPTPCRFGNGGTWATKQWANLGVSRYKMNPNHQEWLMMWPQGWTELTPQETGKFQQWRQRHGGF